jgi:predicted membrane channel-forming protein YqfA (hemolysin III family)
MAALFLCRHHDFHPAAEFNVLSSQLEATQFHPLTLVTAAITVLGVITGITLWTKSARAIPMVQVYFLTLGGFALFDLGILLTTGGSDDDGLVTVSYVRTVIYVIIWAIYFRRSERVRATFGRNL